MKKTKKVLAFIICYAGWANAAPTLTETEAGRSPASYRPEVYNETSAIQNDSAPQAGANSNMLTGDWGGRRTKLSEAGADLAVIYKYEAGQVLSGEQAKRSTALQNLDVKLLLDAEKFLGLKQTSVFIYGLGDWGADSGPTPSSIIGDSQGTSNIETAADNFKLYELWIQKKFFGEKVSILMGIHDLNSEFYATDSSGLFLNSSFGVGKELAQTGPGGPSIFPSTTGSVRFKYESPHEFYFQSAVFNAKASDPSDPKKNYWAFTPSDGFLLINEFAITGAIPQISKLGLGQWTYTRLADHRTETVTDSLGNIVAKKVNNSGVYLLLDSSVTDSLSVVVRAGTASAEANNVKSNYSMGLNWATAFVGQNDKLGLAMTTAHPSDESLNPETVYEMTYRFDWGRGFVIQPDLQYVINSGYNSSASDCLAGKLRFEFGL